jgi:hypothetical protein
MGSIYRANDSRTGKRVALKLMHTVSSPEAAYRFSREAVLLAELNHPAIVSYVAHGVAEGGQPFLAMEWLQGEDLAHRLARQPLTLPETLSMLRRVAEGLSTAHQQGIVHRDLKPSNLFLREGRPEDAVLLDFGLARYVVPTLVAVTGSQVVLGTPGYMAPEQASSQADITASADLFSLGCVLYECLTGQAPFAAPHFAAVLAKILFASPAPLSALRAGLAPGLQVLVDRMLAKTPQRRMPDAASLLEALSALESVPGLLQSPSAQDERPPSLTKGAEQQLVSVLLVSLQAQAVTGQEEEVARRRALRDALREVFAPYGAKVELLADGSLIATLVLERGTATDQAALAVRCALTFKERHPEASVVLTTGRGVVNSQLPVGEAMDRAGRLLRHLEQRPASSAQVVLDEVTAGLLGSGFQLSRFDAETILLRGEQLSADESRPLLGRPTPCVGREQELALLDFTFTTCCEEPAARALLVTAPAGTGKSRLRHEFLRRIERREQPVLVLQGRGNPMSAGTTHALLGQALRRLCGIVDGEDLAARRSRLSQRVALHLPAGTAQEIVGFLGELCATPFPEEANPRLRAARNDPRLMNAQVGRALVSFFKAECAHHPVLLLLEDLHWSDGFSISLMDEVLLKLADQPFMLLALARPEVKEHFPNLWVKRAHEVPLHGLSRKASARLVREVLGTQVTDSVVQWAVEQSDGNALFLEELIRMVAEGRGTAAPQTVLAMLQARLMRMKPEARQLLLAASFFGRSFWGEGLMELLGWQGEEERMEPLLRQLAEEEVIEPQPDSRFPGSSEYRFRHALVRDAAYSLVPDSERPVGHRLAATWLERMDEPDPLELAMHYQSALQLERAAGLYTRAAERIFEQHDLQGTMRCVEAALACGASGEALVRLRALQAAVAYWMDQFPRVLELGAPVLNELKAGGPLWCRMMSGLALVSAHDSHLEQALQLRELLLRTTPEPEAIAAYFEALAFLGISVTWSGARPTAEALLGRLAEVGQDVLAHDAMARGWMSFAKSYILYFLEAKPWQAFSLLEQGSRDFREMGSERNALMLHAISGGPLTALGDFPGAVERLRETLAVGRRMEQHLTVANAQHYLCLALASSPEREHREEARALVLEWMEAVDSHSFRRGMAHTFLAQVMEAPGALHEAESHARKACELLAPFPSQRTLARTVLSTVLLAQERATEARQVAALGVRELEELGIEGVFAVAMFLALAEACFKEGDAGEGETALRRALACVRARASDIPDPAIRERFLRQVPENARTLELARQRWGGSAA